MKLDQLRTFLTVLDQGSFTRAAEALGSSQSTVSGQVAGLESRVGVQLVDRRGGATATPAGRVLQRYARSILELVDEAAAATRAERQVVSGSVTLSASTIPAAYVLPRALARFRRAHPSVTLRVRTSGSQVARQALLDRDCELAVLGDAPSDPRIEGRPVAVDEVVLVGPPGSPEGLESLQGEDVVFREPGSGTHRAVAHLLPSRAVLEVGSTEAARRCVREGIGYAFVSRIAVAEDLAEGRVQLVALPGAPVRRTLNVARLRDVTLTAAARALWQALASDNPMEAIEIIGRDG